MACVCAFELSGYFSCCGDFGKVGRNCCSLVLFGFERSREFIMEAHNNTQPLSVVPLVMSPMAKRRRTALQAVDSNVPSPLLFLQEYHPQGACGVLKHNGEIGIHSNGRCGGAGWPPLFPSKAHSMSTVPITHVATTSTTAALPVPPTTKRTRCVACCLVPTRRRPISRSNLGTKQSEKHARRFVLHTHNCQIARSHHSRNQ